MGNWKMNPRSLKEARQWFSAIAKSVSASKKTEIVICAPFVYLEKLKSLSRKIKLGAQDAYWGDVGAFTGEISSEMLYNIGVRYVILGHSERRVLGEGNKEINKKIKSALASGLRPILCVGENERDESHSYFNFVKTQMEKCLEGISRTSVSKLIIAYEPIWAISSTVNRKDATPEDSREMAIFIRKVLTDKFGKEASFVRVIYGGSSNERDAEDFLLNGGVDGLLPGRASLNPKKFSEMIKICKTLDK